MRRYLEQLHARPAHQKREIAAHAAAAAVVVVFLAWAATLGVRLAAGGVDTTVANSGAASLVAATAEAGSAFQSQVAAMTEAQPGAAQSSGLATTTVAATPQSSGATFIGAPNDPATSISSQ